MLRINFKKFLVVFLAFLCFKSSLYAQKTYSLQECVNLALENNIQVKQQSKQTENAFIDVKMSRFAVLPNLNGQVTNNWQTGFNINPRTNTPEENLAFRTNSFGVSSSMNLFNGFQTSNNIRLRLSDYKVSRYDLENARNNLKLNVASNYLRVLQQIEVLNAARNQVATTNVQLERQQKLYDLGGLNKSRLLQLKAQIAAEQLNLITQQNVLNSAYLDLWQLIDVMPDSTSKIEQINLEKVLIEDENRLPQAIYNDFEKTSPDVLAAKQRERSAELQKYISKGGRSFRLSLNASLSSFYTTLGTSFADYKTVVNPPIGFFMDGNTQVFVHSLGNQTFPTRTFETPFSEQFSKNFGTSIGLTLSLPIFNGWNANSAVQRATIQMESAKLNEKQVQQNLFKNINTAFLNFKNAQQRYSAAMESLAANKEAADISEKQYELGGLSVSDFLNAKNAFIRSETDFLQAKYELVFRKKVLDFYSGKPIN
jgi:outer membrane protein